MNRDQIIEIVTRYVNQAVNGQQVENAKVDLKRDWYDLSDLNGLNEFIKDSCSIANTPGPDGFIIIGLDEKNNKQKGVSFADSGLKDSNELVGLINKKVDRAYDIQYLEAEINNISIGIIHIPPSFDKPHVIRNYQKRDKKERVVDNPHRLFIRSDTTTREATKADIERMIFDRKNIQPEYQFDVYINRISFGKKMVGNRNMTAVMATICIENSGRRPASIFDLALTVEFASNSYVFGAGKAEYDTHGSTTIEPIRDRNIIIRSNDIWLKRVELYQDYSIEESFLNEAMKKGGIQGITAEFSLNTGKRIIQSCDLLYTR